MHSRGGAAEVHGRTSYTSVVGEIASELAGAIDAAIACGVSREAILIDPGLGFSKQAQDSLDVLANLDDPRLRQLDRPFVVGPSRKSFLTSAAGTMPPAERDWATAAAVTGAILLGAHVVRVHRVREMVQVARVADALRGCHRRHDEAPAPSRGALRLDHKLSSSR
jgi:dihydropteroate synthase